MYIGIDHKQIVHSRIFINMFGIAVRPTTLPEHSNNIQTCTFCNGSTTLLHLALVDKNDKEDDKNAIF